MKYSINVVNVEMNECDGGWIQHRNVAGCFSSNSADVFVFVPFL